MNMELCRDDIEALLVGLRLANYEMNKSDSLLFDYDKMTLRDGRINNLYGKLSEELYLDGHNKVGDK